MSEIGDSPLATIPSDDGIEMESEADDASSSSYKSKTIPASSELVPSETFFNDFFVVVDKCAGELVIELNLKALLICFTSSDSSSSVSSNHRLGGNGRLFVSGDSQYLEAAKMYD